MKYNKNIILKNNQECILKTPTKEEASSVLEVFIKTHAESQYLLSLPEEIKFTEEDEATYLSHKEASENEIEICAYINGKIGGTAGFEPIGKQQKIKHRATFGIAIESEYQNLGIGKALTNACIECTKKTSYEQLELEVVSTNTSAINLYNSLGFKVIGINPKGFKTKDNNYQQLILMILNLN